MANHLGKNDLSSNVPNDYHYLSPAGSLDMPLRKRGRRRRPQVRRRGGMPNWFKALLALGGILLALALVGAVVFAIAFPPFFRSLEPRYQQRLIDMFPPFDALRPTVPFEVLPTLGTDGDNAAQLLLTQEQHTATPLPTAAPTEGVTGTPAPTEDTGIPIGMAPTAPPTPLPTYVPPTQAQPQPTWTPLAQPTQAPLPKTYKLDVDRIRYELQGWNNCGPTTITMALTYYGWVKDQYYAAQTLKPNPEDKNVSPWQLVRFVNDNAPQTGIKALYRIGGTPTVLKRLLAADFPVVVEESIQPEGEGWMGHYVLMVGYDDYEQHFLTYDSYLGSNEGNGRPSPYSIFEEKWRHFNRMFLVVYPQEREMELRAALGDYVDPTYGYHKALEMAREEANRNRDDKWAWFNMGSAYVALGQYDNAAIAYNQALQLGLPFRMLWYQFGPYEAYYHVGDYNNVRALARSTLAVTPYVEESYYWIGMAYAAEGNTAAALEQFNLALRYNPNFAPAKEAKAQVEAGTFTVASVH